MSDYYIYVWFNDDWGGVPFYIGMGQGRRFCAKSGRSIAFTKFINRWNCSPLILLDGLSEETAKGLERALKEAYILEGYPIIDAESEYRRKVSQKVATRKAIERGVKFGRPSIKLDGEFEKFLKKQKGGEISVRECCEQLGISRATWYNKIREVS